MDCPFPSDIAFTPAVKALQQQLGSREIYARMERSRGWQTKITPELLDIIAGLDMFYLGTATAEGQPYIQYRGGAAGFLKVLDDRTLGFADFSGNQQYISTGNLSENPRAFIFLMDYVHRRRVKIWGKARILEDDPELLKMLQDPGYDWPIERAIVFTVEAWDANCPQHIHSRIRADEAATQIERLRQRIDQLESELKASRSGRRTKPNKQPLEKEQSS